MPEWLEQWWYADRWDFLALLSLRATHACLTFASIHLKYAKNSACSAGYFWCWKAEGNRRTQCSICQRSLFWLWVNWNGLIDMLKREIDCLIVHVGTLYTYKFNERALILEAYESTLLVKNKLEKSVRSKCCVLCKIGFTKMTPLKRIANQTSCLYLFISA